LTQGSRFVRRVRVRPSATSAAGRARPPDASRRLRTFVTTETYLKWKFGVQSREYRGRVRRWL